MTTAQVDLRTTNAERPNRESPGSPPGRFAVVRVGGVNFDFSDAEKFEAHHYALHVSDEKFDAIFGRAKARG